MSDKTATQDELTQKIFALKDEGMSNRAIGKKLDVDESTVRRRLAKSYGHYPAPEGHTVKGVSTLYDGEGNVTAQWVKTRVDEEQLQASLDAAIVALCEKVEPQEPIVQVGQTMADLANLYVLSDSHIGMLAWHKEGGEDFDLKIAEAQMIACFERMIAQSPPAKVGIVGQLGDLLHCDGFQPLTPASGHVLDADSRFPKMVEIAVRTMRRIVNLALQKHDVVHVLMAEGNHSPASDVWLRELFSALYENEPRVAVEKSPLPYYVYEHGKTMIGFHHSHLKKMDQLPMLFAAQFSEIWGKTKYRYAHTGHMHHTRLVENGGIVVEQHPTLAARDAYAARGGYISMRAANAITYSTKFGEVGRVRVTPEMID